MFWDVPERVVPKSGMGTRGRGRRDASSGTRDAGTRDVGLGEVTSGTQTKRTDVVRKNSSLFLHEHSFQFTVNPRHARPVFLKFERSFEIYMPVLNIRRHRDFRVPVEISLVYRRYKAMNFPLHNSIKYFKNNIFSQVFLIFFSSFSERFPEKCSTVHSNAWHSQRGIRMFISFREILVTRDVIDCNCVADSLTRDFASLHVENETQGYK